MRRELCLGAALLLVGAAGFAVQRETTQACTLPKARTVDVVDDYHGTPVPDPYRWLEDVDSPETRAWIEGQNCVTFQYLRQIPGREAIRQRLTELWNYERYGAPFREGGRYFYFRNEGLQNQSVLYTQTSLDGEPRVLLDPNELSEDGTVALSALAVSKDGRYLAYGVSVAGSDWQEFHVREVETGSDLPDHLRWIKFSGASWTHDGAGFFYGRYPEPEGGNVLQAVNRYRKIYYHRLGTDQSGDILIYERPDQPDWGMGASVTDDGRYAVISISVGTDERERVSYIDLVDPKKPQLANPVVSLLDEYDASYELVGNEGPVFYFLTDLEAPRQRLIAVDTRDPARVRWREIIPQMEDKLQDVEIIHNTFVAEYLHDAHSRLRLYALDGRFLKEIELPTLGSVTQLSGKKEGNEMFFAFTSFLYPTTIFRYDFTRGELSVWRAPKMAFDASPYVTTQVFYTSKDGTRVPMFLTHRKDLKRDGRNPTYLYGYGGFNISITPSFSASNVVWLEMGGIYAVANLRGGGEYGEEWHRAGMLENKQNVFDDFIAAAEYLIAEEYTSPAKLAIGGGSNGGLLVGAVMTQRPELFGAALPAVGVMDMLRFHKFTIGWAWVSDYGSADSARHFPFLYAYSPYHNVREGVDYPATLVTTADHDDRVVPGHSFKFAARLQAAHAGPDPVLIRIETRAGHGAGKPTSKIIEEQADRWAFLVKNLGMTVDLERRQAAEKKGRKTAKGLPLEVGRHATFTTSEGSWISLDVSPDGKTIVFDLLGDLYTLPITGGKATSLTRGMAFDSQPRFSPDGKRVVFTSDRDGGENLWILSLDLKDTVQVTKAKDNLYQSPEWTPDGKYIVASKVEGSLGVSKLWMYHVDGGSGAQLVKEPENLKMMGAAFGPDGRYIWYAERTGSWQYNAILPQYQLAIYDRETGKRYPQSQMYGSAFRPTLSPDGKWLVYGTRHDAHTGLRIRDLATGDERWLAYPVQRDDQESRATRDVLPGMSFTPDSKALVASYGGNIWRIPIDGSAPSEIPFAADVDMELGPALDFDYAVDDAPTFTVRQIRDAVPSPDGKRLAFTALDRVWVMDYPGGTPRRLTSMEIGEHQPTWSPDGQWIAYATWSVEGGHLYKVRPTGKGKPQRLTATHAYYRNPAWSPEGSRIAAVRSSAQAFLEEVGGPSGGGPGAELVWVPAAGGEATRIAPTEGRGTPHFTRDPSRIYVYSPTDGLVSMRWDGTDLKSHLKVTGPKLPGAQDPINASLVLISPDGERALAQVVNDLYVVTVPYVGGATPTVSVAEPDKAAFPVRKLTVVGGQFPAWSADGTRVHWSIGNGHFVYDVDAAKAAEDSAQRAAKAEEADTARAQEAKEEEREEEERKPVYEARETRVTISARRDIPDGIGVLRGARVITMKGDEVIEKGDVVVRNNRIVAVGPAGHVAVPEGAQVIDVTGKTIIPGFVDVHAHLRPAWGIHKTQVWQYLANLAYGVTTTRDPQTGTTDVLSYSDLVEAGALLGPRVYSTGPGVFSAEQVKSLDDARNVLKRYSEYYDTKTIKQYVAGNRQQRQWIIMAARELRLMPTTEGALDLKLDLTQILDGYPGHEHSFPIYPLYRDVVELVARSKTTYTPTLLVAYGGPWAENYFYATEEVHDDAKLRRWMPHSEVDERTLRRPWFRREQHVFDDHAKFLKDLVEAGGRAGVGGHGQLQGLGYHWELWAMQSGGLSEHDALRVATIFGAEAIGLDQDLGSIEPGKLADLIVLEKNPLEDIRHTNTIRYVMKNGRLYDGDTLDEVWPRQKKLERMWWWDREPATAAGLR